MRHDLFQLTPPAPGIVRPPGGPDLPVGARGRPLPFVWAVRGWLLPRWRVQTPARAAVRDAGHTAPEFVDTQATWWSPG